MDYFPVAIRLRNKKVIVVGGGKVAHRKVATLLDSKALIQIVTPKLSAELKNLADKGIISWVKKSVEEKDIKGATLIISATDRKKINSKASRWAKKRGIPINVVDNSYLSDFISPALVKKDKALVAVYSDGRDPVLSRDLKNYLNERWNDFLLFRDKL
ncbi:MAG: bifunctional precorrin-2 dehydrogenase/sirohydrochlorin ferrochelatase [Candidatus Omnitrophica bacterium]|jgi:siroheme synthase-like protein|nr:bifunctional precorrin-2 dehydrogenase/sirohydrochlorin ferrochelatase [Candidatus Omnitrophota bacterium]